MGIISKVIIILGLLITGLTNAQTEKVVISEKKTGKRVVLWAENKTADTLNVFLMVHAEGYRRSADKPVMKELPPYSKSPMITLIELKDTSAQYTYDLIVKDETDNASQANKVVDIENAVKGKLVLFRLTQCPKCNLLEAELKNKRVQYQSFDISKDGALYAQFMSFIDAELTSETRIRFPIVWNRTHTIFGYDELESVLSQIGI